MKKFMLSYICLLSISTNLAYGTTEWASLKDYYSDMEKQGKPKVLIVGCGHIEYGHLEGKHTHEDCWCVDIQDPKKYEPKWLVSKSKEPVDTEKKYENYAKYIGSNEEFDIALKYDNFYGRSFDVVVLERNYEATLLNSRTLYNATRMLKPNGQLWVDIHRSYLLSYDEEQKQITPQNEFVDDKDEVEAINQYLVTNDWLDHFYSHSRSKKWKDCLKSIKESYESDDASYEACVNKFNDLRKTLPNYGIQYKIDQENPEAERVNKGLLSMGKYLAMWYYKDIIIADNGMQPYCKRSGQFLVAKKTKFTEQQEKSWLEGIKEFEKNNKNKF